MKSPCIKVCKIKKGIDYISLGSQLICVGCGRTLEQIRDWTTYTDEQRDSIMEKLNGQHKYVVSSTNST